MNSNAQALPTQDEKSRAASYGKPVSTQMDFLRRTVTQPKAVIGLVIMAIFILMAIFAPFIAPNDPSKYVGLPHQPPSAKYWLGTTGQGQDVFSQMVWGARISLLIGFSVGILSTVLGLVIGMISGYLPGVVDGVLNMFTNVFLLIPGLPLDRVLDLRPERTEIPLVFSLSIFRSIASLAKRSASVFSSLGIDSIEKDENPFNRSIAAL